MLSDTDPTPKFFSAPGKIKLKPILKKVKTNTTMTSIFVNNYIIIKIQTPDIPLMKLRFMKNAELLKLKTLSMQKKSEITSFNFPSSQMKKNIKMLKLNKVDSNNSDNYYNNLNLPVPKKRRKYIFGDFVSLVEKYNMLHRFVLIKNAIRSTTYKFDVEVRRKYKSLKKNNVQNFNFDRYIRDIFYSINFNFNYYERNYQKKLNAHKFFIMIRKYILLILKKRMTLFICFKKNTAIQIQSTIRRFIFQKKFNVWKADLINKIIIIQKNARRFLVKKKYKGNIVSIIDFIKYNQRMKEYEKNLKIMKKKKNAIRIIENWWESILEERKRKELEERIKKMPKDCQKLYRQFIRLGKQTKIIKRDFNEFFKKKVGFVP